MTVHARHLGVDVAKDWIDVFDPETGRARRIETTAAKLRAFAHAVPEGTLVVFEASGGYERPLQAALGNADVPGARVNPRQAREFARAAALKQRSDSASQGGRLASETEPWAELA
jgi:transposase